MMTRLLTEVRPAVTDTGLLALRLAIAAVFIAHGAGDVFDAGVSNNVQNYADVGIPVPELAAPFAAYIMGFASLTLPLLGPGRLSLDALLVRRRDRTAGAAR